MSDQNQHRYTHGFCWDNRWGWYGRIWRQVQERWYTIYEHWYPLLTDEWPEDVVAFEAEWFYYEVPLAALRGILEDHDIEQIWELRGEEAPLSFELSCDRLEPYYTGDEGYWTSKDVDWLIYASDQSSLTIAGGWLLQAVKALWPTWEQHVWKGADYVRPPETVTPRPRGAFPGYERVGPYVRFLSRAERESLWGQVEVQWNIHSHYWFPLTTTNVPAVIAVEELWFQYAIPVATLHEILRKHGIRRVYKKWESGTMQEMDLEIVEIYYAGSEAFWTSKHLDWLVYASHESSITIAGEWLIAEIKWAWPEWEQHLYKNYDYEKPPGFTHLPESISFPGEEMLPAIF